MVSRRNQERKKRRGDWKVIWYVCLSWGKIFRRAQLSRPKIFLSADHPWSRKQLSIHSRQTAGELQVSLFAFTVKRSKIPVPPLPAGKTPFALLELPGSPPSLGGSGLSGANFMWESLHQHGARWPLLRAYKFFPHLAVGHSWPLRSLRLVKSFVSCCPLRCLPSLGDHQSD